MAKQRSILSRRRERCCSAFYRPRLETLEKRLVLAAIFWTGEGDGASWNNPLNWDSGVVPTADDDVVLDVAANPTVTASGPITIKSLTSREALVIASGAFTVTSGTSQIDAALTVSPGAALIATGSGATFTQASGSASVLSLPNLETITGAGDWSGIYINPLLAPKVQLMS